MFDKMKDMANDLIGGKLSEYTDGLNFPAGKDEVLAHLESKGVPDMVLDRVRDVDTTRFDSFDDLKKTVGL
jgi:hypothetical protein